MKLIADILGILVFVFSLISCQMKRKQHMMLISAAANLISGMSFLFLSQRISSAVMLNFTAVAQCLSSSFHAYKDAEISKTEKVVFLVLYTICGATAFKVPLDLMPITGSLVFMISAFQKSEQRIRYYMLVNALIWIIYDIIVGSTAVFSQIFSLISLLISLYRFRGKKKEYR